MKLDWLKNRQVYLAINVNLEGLVLLGTAFVLGLIFGVLL